ncbi:hypothetical protein GBAR_LOCUS936 [Geodia barretti]|nr:hypothetical protein GBAR_LOCUS936 [Geodia barretti]
MWGVAGGVLPRLLPWLRGSALRSRLESHLRYIFTTDCLIKVEGGPNHLEKKDLEKLCLERCLVSEEEREMEEFLEKWVHISTEFHECPPYLLAHLPLLLQQSKRRTH